MPNPKSAPLQLFMSSTQEDVFLFYYGKDGDIWMQSWNGSKWTNNNDPLMNNCCTEVTPGGFTANAGYSIGYADKTYGQLDQLLYRDKDSKLNLAYLFDNSWIKHGGLPYNAPLISGPSAVVLSDDQETTTNVFYYTEDGVGCTWWKWTDRGPVHGGTPQIAPCVGPNNLRKMSRPAATIVNNEIYVFYLSGDPKYNMLPVLYWVRGKGDSWSNPECIGEVSLLGEMTATTFGGYIHLAHEVTLGQAGVRFRDLFITPGDLTQKKPWGHVTFTPGDSPSVVIFSDQLHFVFMPHMQDQIIRDSFFINADPSNWTESNMYNQNLTGIEGLTKGPPFDRPPVQAAANLNWNQYHVCYWSKDKNLEHLWYDTSQRWQSGTIYG